MAADETGSSDTGQGGDAKESDARGRDRGISRDTEPGDTALSGDGIQDDAATSDRGIRGGADPHGSGAIREQGSTVQNIRGSNKRRRRILAWVSGVAAGCVAAAAVTLYLGYRHLDGNIHVRDIGRLVGSQPPAAHPRAENILVVGSDSRAGTHGYGSAQVYNTAHSDTMMIVHIAASGKWAEVVSIPRDSWVHIPACDMGNGQKSQPTDFKINESFTAGSLDGDQATGAACTIKTLERDTGLRIDHFVAINFAGFKDMVNALGGVEVCTRQAIDDQKAKLYLSAGRHLLMGQQALAYVRARYSLGNGSDLERIGRQQAFMSSLASRAKSELYNPIAIYRFLDAATKSITIDNRLGGITGLYNLANRLRSLPTSELTFITLPTFPRSVIDPTDTANVMWQQPTTKEIFNSLRDDVPWHATAAGQPASVRSGAPGVPRSPSVSPSAVASSSPQPSPAVTTRTANQNICNN
jgi:LCP family protein required for cell wall assembly